MAKAYPNRVWMTTATTGTGTMTLGSAKAGYMTPAEAGVADADTVSYVIEDGTNFEIGLGTYTTSGTTLSRDTVTASKISGTAGTTKLTLSGTATVYLTPLSADLLFANRTATITKGFGITPYSIGTPTNGSTVTPDPANHNYQYLTNNVAGFTLAAPTSDCTIDILITNGASAGAVTFSGFTVSASVGDALTTTNTSKFVVSIRRINAVATYTIKALQ